VTTLSVVWPSPGSTTVPKTHFLCPVRNVTPSVSPGPASQSAVVSSNTGLLTCIKCDAAEPEMNCDLKVRQPSGPL
jgi:hypothetical protein